MVNEGLAQSSNTLFNVALIAYIVAMVAYFFRLAFTRVSADGVVASSSVGRRVGLAGTVIASLGWAAHVASVTSRGLAAGRVPWANMYEYSSLLALCAVAVGLVVVQRRLGYGHLVGFVLAAAVLSMTIALLLFTPAGPVVPALNSYWIKIHTSGAMAASSIFMVGFVATALYLVKDTAERRVAERSSTSFTGSTVGAAHVDGPGPVTVDARPEGYEADGGLDDIAVASPMAHRDVLSPVFF